MGEDKDCIYFWLLLLRRVTWEWRVAEGEGDVEGGGGEEGRKKVRKGGRGARGFLFWPERNTYP